MTVCIATISEGMIFGIADRMKTVGDIEYEPSTAKIFQITSSIAVMTSGDAAFQAEILRKLYLVTGNMIKDNPDEWLKVIDIAYLYAQKRNEIKAKRAENNILLPLGLTMDSFVAKQGTMSEGFINSITKELLNFEIPDVSVIVAGIDATGPHIFLVYGDEVSCRTTVGFASIGIGSRHANSQLMLGRYGTNTPMAESLLLTYVAKKRSEVSPGVGEETDMFIVAGLGGFTTLKTEHMEKLNKEYKKISVSENRALSKARKEMHSYVKSLSEKQEQKPQEIPAAKREDDGREATNEQTVSESEKEIAQSA